MSIAQVPCEPAGRTSEPRVFLHLEELLSHYARTAASRDAILAPDGAKLTFGELQASVEAAVGRLRMLGIRRGDRVAVVLPNGPETAVAILAAATAAVCLPLNPNFTADEWHRYFVEFQLAALLTRPDIGSPSRSVAHSLGIPVIDLSPQANRGPGAFELVGSGAGRISDDSVAPNADRDAFILLTSGTTARPKLVPLTHASVCLSAYNAGAALALEPHDRLLNVLPLYHAHGLISALLTALAAGSTVVCTHGFDSDAFFDWLTMFQPTWYTAVPSIHLALLTTADRHKRTIAQCSLRVVRSASATLPPDVLGKLESLFGVPVIETYGMTEAASQIAANPIGGRKPGSVGRSAGAEIRIMDGEGRALPAGERGEIALRGPTLARGYENDIVATKAAFCDGWFRTGDAGYLDQDGYLFIVGRLKEIIKRGGQQVAPVEVEEVLVSHPDVLEAAVFSVPHAQLGEDVAAALVVRPGANVSPQNLRDFARERLARFKVPGPIRIVPQIPKGPSGKVKRGDLATIFSDAIPSGESRADKTARPRSELENQLARIWAELLHVDQVGPHQDVFALGANSLVLTQMLSRLRKRFGADLSIKDLFDAPTVAALATRIGSSEAHSATTSLSLLATAVDGGKTPLSFQQQRIHLLSRLDPIGHNYHVCEVVRLLGPLAVDVLEASIAAICERHEILRSTFHEGVVEPLQLVGTIAPALERIEMRPCAGSKRAEAIQRETRELLRQGLDIENAPPLRAHLLRLDEQDHALVIRIHHVATDGWSQELFWEELAAHYRVRSQGGARALPELAIQYRHFVEWQRAWLRAPAAEDQLRYWRAQLDGLTELPLHTDRPRPGTWTGRGARHPFELSRAMSQAVKSLSRAHGVTAYMALLAAFKCLLHRYTGHEDIAVGSLIANRNQIELERLIGMFANTIVLRTDLSGEPKFSEVLRRIRQVTLDAYRNQDLPLEKIVQVLQVARSPDRHPLFQVMFILQSAVPRGPSLPGLAAQFVDVDAGVARFDLTLELFDADERLTGWFEYSTELFDTATIARMAGHLQTILEAVVADPGEQISRLPLLTAAERKRLLDDWNDTRRSLPRGTFFEQFARQVERTPHAIAVSAGPARLSYRELAHRASAIAGRLASEGVGPDVVVVLLAKRGGDLLAAMIAVQQAGGAFLPLDPVLPPARLAQIIEQSRTPLVLVERDCAAALKAALSEMPVRERPRALSLEGPARRARRRLARRTRPAASNLAYVIYTSGSTGVPKGAMIEQRGLINHLLSQISDLDLSATDIVAQTAPQSFVLSIWQFLAGLMVGARIHICADEEVQDPALLVRQIAREGVTVLQIVPSLLREILERTPNEPIFRALGRLRWLFSTGEALPPDLCRDWFMHFPGVPMLNGYGSTECSDDVATHCHTAAPASLASVPIGRPIANMRLYVLDAHLQPQPIGVAGELYVAGVGIGRGYLNAPEQTARAFLRDPFSNRPTARLYKTGDLARWRADQTLEYLGRVDHQVKLRGYRIEPAEIEHALLEREDVQAAVVLARNDLGGEARLVAHIVAARGRQPSTNELRDFLKTKLPAYMIPAGFIFLDRVPLTAHGKVDRPALKGTRRGLQVACSTFEAPRDPTERVLVDMWADLLGAKDVGVSTNFFDLGGHSLLAGRVLVRVATVFGVSLPIRALFEEPTVEGLARRIQDARQSQASKSEAAVERREEESQQPVSFVQEDVLRLERELPGLPQFNVPFTYRLRGPLDVPALERSFAEVVRRHESLCTAFAWSGGRPVPVVTPATEIDVSLVAEDLAGRIGSTSESAKALLLKKAELLAEQEAWTPVDVARAPLLRTRLLRLGPTDHVLILILHHVIVDGWSIGIFVEEVSQLYAAFTDGRQGLSLAPAPQFSDFVRQQRRWSASSAATQQLFYWRQRLRGASPVFSGTNRKLERQLLASPIAHEEVDLPKNLVDRLSALGHSRASSLFMTLLTGFKTLLLAWSGHTDICVATAMAGRPQQETERLIGLLVNTTLIRTQLAPDLTFEEALGRVRDSVLEAYARQEMPFAILAARLAEEGGPELESLTQINFVLQNPFPRSLQLSDVTVSPFGNVYREGQPVLPIGRTWLSVMLKQRSAGITGSCNYKSDLFQPKALQDWLAAYPKLLAKAARDPGMSLRRLVDHGNI